MFFLEKLSSGIDLESYSPRRRLEVQKALIRAAAKATRDFILLCEAQSKFSLHAVCLSIARAVARQDRALAAKLISVSDVAKDAMQLAADRIALVDPAKFARMHDTSLAEQIQTRMKGIQDEINARGGDARVARQDVGSQSADRDAHIAMQRLEKSSKRWSPFNKTLILHGIYISDSSASNAAVGQLGRASGLGVDGLIIARSAGDKLNALAGVW